MKSIRDNIDGMPVCISKGRKRQFFCNVCRYSDIVENNDSTFSCNHCGYTSQWKSRLSESFDGTPLEVLVRKSNGQNTDHLTYERNHEPDQQGIWFDYTGFRYKDHYDIELMSGTIAEKCRPNADCWNDGKTGEVYHDSQVRQVRLKPDSELDYRNHLIGQDRIDHNLEMFGEPDE